MKKDVLSKIWMIFLFLLLVGFLIWGIFYVDDTDKKISILGIVAIIVAAFTSVLTVSINNKKAREREYEFHVLKEKQKVFEHFYNSYFEILFNVKKDKSGLSRKAEGEMLLFKKGLMNWGSDKIIKKYLDFDNKLQSIGKENQTFNILSIILTAEARSELEEKKLI